MSDMTNTSNSSIFERYSVFLRDILDLIVKIASSNNKWHPATQMIMIVLDTYCLNNIKKKM